MNASQRLANLLLGFVGLSGTMICLCCAGAPSSPIYVSNFGNNTIVRIAPDGSVATWTNPNLNGPTGLALDGSGNLYVANQFNNTIVKFDPVGNGTIFAQGGLSSPVGLAFDGQFNLYVANPGNNTIVKLDPNGHGSIFASTGLSGPEGIAFDSNTNLYVANYWGNNIAKIDPAGNLSLFTTISNPEGLAFDSAGFLYASTQSSNNAVIKFDAAGAPSTYFVGASSYSAANGLVFDGNNNLYVVYYWPSILTEVAPNGTSFQAAGPPVLDNPIFIALANPVSFPANIYQQPTNHTVVIGQTAVFTVGAAGTWPLSYQWAFNGTSIAGATNFSLVLTNVQMNQAGTYSVVVTNAYGSATSSNATLVVNLPPALVSVSPTSGTAGSSVTVPILIVANGNENALGFSVNFDSTSLTNAGVALGTGASGGSLIFNTNQVGNVGVGVALPSGTTFAPGTQEVAEISFISTISQTNFSTALSFGDQPTKRELADVTANTLPVNFVGGQLSFIHSAFEADVAPRPNGDGEVTISDWAQVGRFVAALDSPTNATEFQRADCAPRDTLGDGLLTVSDWVQAGRYAAGLDPLTVAGGPTAFMNNVAIRLVRPKGGQRIVNVQGPILFDGQTGTTAINLDAQGDENAVGLSLAFDPTVLTYVGASYGADAVNAAGMQVNSNQATNGQLGIILALPSDVSFSPGIRQIIKVNFKATTTASVNSALTLTDVPVRRDIADVNATSVSAIYDNGTVSVNPLPSLAIFHTSQSISVSWPLWATNYVLQNAVGSSLAGVIWTNVPASPILTNNALSVTLPVAEEPHFYRLQHQ